MAVSVRNVQDLCILELRERFSGGRGAVPIALKFGDDLALPRNVSRTSGEVCRPSGPP